MAFVQRNRRWLIPAGVFLLLILASLACLGSSADVKGFNLRKAYFLKAGEQLDGDQLIVANDIHLETGSVLQGDATLIGSRVDFDAQVEGDVVVIADSLRVGDSAQIKGDLFACVDALSQSEKAQIAGQVKRQCNKTDRVSVTRLLQSGLNSWRENFFFRLTGAIGGALMAGALAALSTVIFPQPLIRMSDSVRRAPITTGGIGCLTVLVAVGLTVIYTISLILVLPVILLPFAVLAWVVIGLLSLLGWVALAEPFGRAVFRRAHLEPQPPMIAAAIGGITLTALVRVWSIFPFTEWIGLLATVVLGSIGLGAVVLTRVGTRTYPRPEPASAVVKSKVE